MFNAGLRIMRVLLLYRGMIARVGRMNAVFRWKGGKRGFFVYWWEIFVPGLSDYASVVVKYNVGNEGVGGGDKRGIRLKRRKTGSLHVPCRGVLHRGGQQLRGGEWGSRGRRCRGRVVCQSLGVGVPSQADNYYGGS